MTQTIKSLLSLPEVLLRLVCRLYMINQRVKAKMDPTTTTTTEIHRVGLSTTIELGLTVVFMALSWFTTVRGGSVRGGGQPHTDYLNS